MSLYFVVELSAVLYIRALVLRPSVMLVRRLPVVQLPSLSFQILMTSSVGIAVMSQSRRPTSFESF